MVDSITKWLRTAETESLTSDVTRWLVLLMADDLELLPDVAGRHVFCLVLFYGVN